MAVEINERYSKQQIFELYANEVYLGNRGSFSIRGFGEAAEAYFGKDVRELSVGECAFLGGIIRAPNRYASAERHPERAEESRDRVLAQMVEDSYITQEQADDAKKQKLKFLNGGASSSSAAEATAVARVARSAAGCDSSRRATCSMSALGIRGSSACTFTTMSVSTQVGIAWAL